MGKRYYWLKLPDDFFRQKPIKKLRRIAGGDTYTIIYLKMLLVSLKNEGKLFFDGVEENFTEEIALELDEEEENVKVTVQFLIAQGLLQLIDESEYELTECSRMVGSESASAERMRRLRDKKTSQCDIGVTQQLHLSDVEKEKEIEIDKDKEIENKYICPEVNSGQPQPKVEIEPSCSKAELKVETEPAQADVFIKLPLINGDDYLVTKEYVKELKELYPAVDVEQALRNMRGWLDSNPRNKKTPRGIKRFITSWISREQDKAPRVPDKSKPVSQNRFNNFHQRDYDFAEYERQLLKR
ncbi:phage replisome organizer N-terminal domain-containing protein [Blautia wexlerae]|uniref:phage replisome organizer N-terminal domain-containing protein n=1 Tax=Blautia wexlerae TaxID=418240 RepID=UPI001898C8B0|nr:phage replisome organizer N-terminal domain-containing protein [Blautia wexlerae]MDC0697409.1 phage replisome organizer N-terminal domain-containing protein [Blautia wexlerae]